MRIENSSIKLSSKYNQLLSQKDTRITITKPVFKNDSVDISSLNTISQNPKTQKTASEYNDMGLLSGKKRIACFLIELMFGVKINKHINFKRYSGEPEQQRTPQEEYEVTNIEFTERLEKENVEIAVAGNVVAADGKTYDFNLSLSLGRSFYETGISIKKEIQRKDPIILNLSGVFTGLSDKTIDFDIDADGESDKIHFVKEGSGFLVIDKNNDGRINDGTEVIGAKSNNAIEELSLYDDDKNGWIDEADNIFAKLSVWEKDATGKDIITTLKDRGIGAICLSSINSPFQIKNQDQSYGEILDSGIFMFENGRASFFHKIDLFV